MDAARERKPTLYLVRRFAPYFRKYKYILLLDLFFASLTTVCELVLPLILRYMTDMGAKDVSRLRLEGVWQLAGIYFVLRLLDLVGKYYMANVGHVMGAKIETDMRRDVFDHLQNLSDTFYNNTKVGQIMARITTDLFDVTEFAHHCPEEFFIGGLKILVAFVVLIQIDVPLTLCVFLMLPLMVFSVSRFNRRMRTAFKRQRNHIGDLNAGIEDSLLGVRVVKSFANEDREREKFERDNQRFLGIKKETYRYMAAFQLLSRVFDGLMYLIIILWGGYYLVQEIISPGDFIAYILFVTTLLGTVSRIVEFTEQFQRGMTGIERFVEIMDTPVDIADLPGAVELKHVRGEIAFRQVSFLYPDNKNQVLDAIDFTVRPGENVAIVGPSGSGKTTLCSLIPRFYDVTGGEILLDGRNIRKFTLKSLRSQIGTVQQDVYLFSGTVLDNIEYGRPGANRQEVEQAARMAGAWEFISQLPEGLETYVGERGIKLSGGQKQRISIARVFLKNPPILILDEATSALDNQSERIIQQSLEKLTQGRTTFTIAHRLSTIREATLILVLTEDGIVESGTHVQLMEKNGVYYDLYRQGSWEKEN